MIIGLQTSKDQGARVGSELGTAGSISPQWSNHRTCFPALPSWSLLLLQSLRGKRSCHCNVWPALPLGRSVHSPCWPCHRQPDLRGALCGARRSSPLHCEATTNTSSCSTQTLVSLCQRCVHRDSREICWGEKGGVQLIYIKKKKDFVLIWLVRRLDTMVVFGEVLGKRWKCVVPMVRFSPVTEQL